MTRKAVVLARGLGTRMRRETPGIALGPERECLAAQGLKTLMPLAGRPFLDYVADSLLRAGLRSICYVIAPDAEVLREHAARVGEATGARIECAVQEKPRGTADAVLSAEAFVSGEAFVMCNADNLYPDEALAALARLDDTNCWLAAFGRDELVRCGNIAPERVRDFAVVKASEGGELQTIVEKPADPEQYLRDRRLWVSMNLYRFTPEIFASCRRIGPDPQRGELELTAAVADLMATGKAAFRVLFCKGGVLDLTSRADILAAEAALKGRKLCF
jgi:glucose-1-phosphate thymidylyltransferase